MKSLILKLIDVILTIVIFLGIVYLFIKIQSNLILINEKYIYILDLEKKIMETKEERLKLKLIYMEYDFFLNTNILIDNKIHVFKDLFLEEEYIKLSKHLEKNNTNLDKFIWLYNKILPTFLIFLCK